MTSLSQRAITIARRIDRLEPDRRDPERFHADKSELANEAKKLATKIEERRA